MMEESETIAIVHNTHSHAMHMNTHTKEERKTERKSYAEMQNTNTKINKNNVNNWPHRLLMLLLIKRN